MRYKVGSRTMPAVFYREAEQSDIPAMARIRAAEWETEEYWRFRISRYLARELHPRQALMPRASYVALEGDALVGFIAGHLTRRFACDGELEWINVIPERRGSGVASELLRLLAAWFATQKASRICVDVEPANTPARRFYTRHGAEDLNPHWLVWNDINVVLGAR
jgi:ribosomal protein S18 acetylase RimI-like enzyme